MKNKFLAIVMTLVVLLSLAACGKDNKKSPANAQKESKTYYDLFDTVISYLEYPDSKEDFEKHAKLLEEEYKRLHKLYDRYNSYEGINNVKTINDKAGKEAVVVDKDLFNLIKYAIESYDKTLGKVNIASGALLEVWHLNRLQNQDLNDKQTKLPKMEDLKEAAKYMDIKSIVLDEEKSSVYIDNDKTSIDLGSIAKGYATELVAKKLEEAGVKHASISAGGNIRLIGTRGGDREIWGIGIQNPDTEAADYLETLYIGQTSVVTSGDYERYFLHNGKKYHHLIDTKTLMPGGDYNSVTIITQDSGEGDLLSTAIFLSSKEEAEEILKNYPNAGVLWGKIGEKVEFTENIKKYMKSQGATNSK